MNYYIQGDAAKADKIKAAFEEKGYSDKGFTFDVNDILFFTANNKHINVCPANGWLANIIKTHPDYQELELPIETKSKFNVGDWIVCWNRTYQIIDNKSTYIVREINSLETRYEHSTVDENGHLWTIADAKDGDILSAKIDGDDYILIFKQIKDGWIETYCHYYITIDKFCAPTQMFCRNYQGRLYPATQEQYRTLFKKMHDDGYEWDFDKKELHKIKPHYDIKNFKPFDKVLVRDGDLGLWKCDIFSDYYDNFYCFRGTWEQCIPFNDDTKHLFGATDMPDEMYINW